MSHTIYQTDFHQYFELQIYLLNTEQFNVQKMNVSQALHQQRQIIVQKMLELLI